MIEKQPENRHQQQSQIDDIQIKVHEIDNKKQNKLKPAAWFALFFFFTVQLGGIAYYSGQVVEKLTSLESNTKDRYTGNDADRDAKLIAKTFELSALSRAVLQKQVTDLETRTQLIKEDARDHRNEPWHTLAGHVLNRLEKHVDYDNKQTTP